MKKLSAPKKETRLLDILIKIFEEETMFSSASNHDHRLFRTIVAWGRIKPDIVIPHLLNHLNDNWHWSGALWEIVGQEKGPHIPEEYAGQGDFITQAWLDWGLANGYVITEPS